MGIFKVLNALLYHLSTDTKPLNYAVGTLAIDDNGVITRWNGSSWVSVVDPAKVETYTNKIFDSELNTTKNILNGPSSRKWGILQPYLGNWASQLLLGPATANGTAGNTWDSTEGYVMTWVSGSVSGNNASWLGWQTNGFGLGRRALTVPRSIVLKCKFKTSNSTSTRLYFGVTNSTTLPTGDTPLGTSNSGVVVGYNNTDTNYTIRNNGGGGATALATAVTGPVTKDANWHTVEIVFNGTTSFTVNFDTVSQTISTQLPDSTVNLIPFVTTETAQAAAKTLSVKYMWAEAA